MSARILVVDDIMPNVKLLEAKLRNEYYTVMSAYSGAEALEITEKEKPDLILLDVMMPEMDGFEVCRRIKANPETEHIPVVMVTALTDATDRVNGLEAGADDFLTKPLEDTALIARVRSLIRLKMTMDEWRARENTAMTFGVIEDSCHSYVGNDTANVLLIEDQGFEADKFRKTIEGQGHMVSLASTGLQAMELINQYLFDVIIVSIDLQGNNQDEGLRFLSHLRSNEKTRSVPILMISNNDNEKISRGLEIGAHDYVVRPVDSNELKARLKTQIRRKRVQEKLQTNYEMSLSMALTDTLTGLFNRRYLNVHLEKLLQNDDQQQKRPIAILMFDIDHFKDVNDTHGHSVGDEVLKVFSDRIKNRLRSFDIMARTGGEEFIAVLIDVPVEKACHIAERLRRSVAENPFPASVEEGELFITTSIGAIHIDGTQNHTVDDVLAIADKHLYEAKEKGRNKVVFEGFGVLNPDDYKETPRAKIEG
jgi:two-component system cell cycle response regulator